MPLGRSMTRFRLLAAAAPISFAAVCHPWARARHGVAYIEAMAMFINMLVVR